MTDSLYALLAFVLTGEEVSLAPGVDSVEAFLVALDEVGWSADAIRTHAAQRWDAEEPWPHPLEAGGLHTIGAARWYAILGKVRTELGLDAERLPPSQRVVLTPEEERLTAEVPPHHGPIG
ncbi:MAG: hypothetical protein LBG99_08885 [Propionibacteriaceae bacterium]|jgi:hypothetical protein|nr:hypothetical protein [Propionibacteriaceae bacterium]